MSGLVLSLFPGIGLLDMAFEQEGFCVVRGPDPICCGDIRGWHVPAGKFDGIIAGPPCQPFSPLVHLVRANGYETKHKNLIPEFERVVSQAAPAWFVMEESPYAPLPVVCGYKTFDAILNNRDLGEKQNRIRRITFGTCDGRPLPVEVSTFHHQEWDYAVTHKSRAVPAAIGGSGKPKADRYVNGQRCVRGGKLRDLGDMLELQGFPRTMLDECPLSVDGKRRAVGNGVPLPMGRAIAKAVKEAIGLCE